MLYPTSIAPGVFRASVAAGPTFATLLAATTYYGQLPAAVAIGTVEPQDITGIVGAALVVVIVGMLLSILPNAFGALLLSRAGSFASAARTPLVWAVTGAALAAPLGLLWSPEATDAVFAFAGTGAICASLCRAPMRWQQGTAYGVMVRAHGGYPAHRASHDPRLLR